ncbi:MAG TPA: hypothetical protein VNQ99_05180 [Xanthobacteraceae bacterium]|nr:hypothetical protein [Xanthobacteraceae bacterium]
MLARGGHFRFAFRCARCLTPPEQDDDGDGEKKANGHCDQSFHAARSSVFPAMKWTSFRPVTSPSSRWGSASAKAGGKVLQQHRKAIKNLHYSNELGFP